MSIEELVKRFVTLASKPTLSKAEHEEARQLMQKLREAGMSNKEISNLSKGRWTPSTVVNQRNGTLFKPNTLV